MFSQHFCIKLFTIGSSAISRCMSNPGLTYTYTLRAASSLAYVTFVTFMGVCNLQV